MKKEIFSVLPIKTQLVPEELHGEQFLLFKTKKNTRLDLLLYLHNFSFNFIGIKILGHNQGLQVEN